MDTKCNIYSLCFLSMAVVDKHGSLFCPQTVKMGVQYSLWGGSVMNLGTERHKKQYFDAIDKFKIPGQDVIPNSILVLATPSTKLCIDVVKSDRIHAWLVHSLVAFMDVLDCCRLLLYD